MPANDDAANNAPPAPAPVPAPDGAPVAAPDPDPDEPPTLTQAQADRHLRECRTKWEADAQEKADKLAADITLAAEAKAREAEEAALAEQGEHKQLAEKHGARVKTLEAKARELTDQTTTLTERAEKAEAAVQGFLDAALAELNLSDATKELLEGHSAVDQLAWLAKHKKELGIKGGFVPPSPDGNTRPSMSQKDIEEGTARTW